MGECRETQDEGHRTRDALDLHNGTARRTRPNPHLGPNIYFHKFKARFKESAGRRSEKGV